MGSVVKALEKAINSMELQKISEVMDKFETQFEDLDVKTAVKALIFALENCRVLLWMLFPNDFLKSGRQSDIWAKAKY